MALINTKVDSHAESRRYASGSRTGIRAAADFSVVLGFKPTHIRVTNLTDRISALHIVDANLGAGANAKSQLSIATGVVTYAAAGVAASASGLGFDVTVATAGLETADDDLVWEAWA